MSSMIQKGTPAGMRWTGRLLSAMVVLFLLFDGVTKLIREPHVVKSMAQLGFPDGLTTGLGATVLACSALYLFPRTSVLGAILLTGWLGGAAAAMVRAGLPGHPAFFPVAFGMLAWLGLS
jgi:DoxX-like family